MGPDPAAFCCPRCCQSFYRLTPGNSTHEVGARCVHCDSTWWLPNGSVKPQYIPQREDPQQLCILGVQV